MVRSGPNSFSFACKRYRQQYPRVTHIRLNDCLVLSLICDLIEAEDLIACFNLFNRDYAVIGVYRSSGNKARARSEARTRHFNSDRDSGDQTDVDNGSIGNYFLHRHEPRSQPCGSSVAENHAIG